MKKLIGIILSSILVFGLVACESNNIDKKVIKNIEREDTVNSPKNTVNALFTNLKQCNFDALSNILVTNKNIGFNNFNEYTKNEKDTFNYWLGKLSYEIKDMNIDGNKASVNTKISALDGNEIYNKYIKNIKDLTPEDGIEEGNEKEKNLANNEYSKALMDAIKDKTNDIVTSTIDIQLEKVNNKWMIKLNDDLINAVFGGLNPQKLDK